jgi:hypothetical protein
VVTGVKNKSLLALAVLLEFAVTSGPVLSANVATFVPGEAAQRQVSKLTSEIHWLDNLNQAEQQARNQDKMIVWIQMLGRIDGAT